MSLDEALDDFDHRLSQWAHAYPLSVFPEPDWKRAHEVLTAAGMTLDAISAGNMRHVVTKLNEEFNAVRKARTDGVRPVQAPSRADALAALSKLSQDTYVAGQDDPLSIVRTFIEQVTDGVGPVEGKSRDA